MKAGTIVQRSRKRIEQTQAVQRNHDELRHKEHDGGIHEIDRQTTHSRVQEAAASTEVPRPKKRRWKPASHLPQFIAPAGYGVKWVRRDGRDRGDCRGLVRAQDEGWEFAKPSDFARAQIPTTTLGGFGDVIGVGDMVLMKMEEDMLAQRQEHYAGKRDTQTYSVEKGSLGETSTIMPAQRPKRSSRTEFVRFRKRRPDAIEAAPDDE